ncbi:hypothetical protein CJ030_MR6G018062 [Morella rubra]|uniref:RING-type E3 ubiquitin transferase BRCA1 n=1 Tax=Morella rubra TaxID=262757 RepID=A0A6A1VFX8_9ROSI|nr:hypothetical protein CJ030_MR6G018062 [Morella rubra]
MECVVATVSGYHGSDRFNLIKLISHAGANYVGALSRSTTHLVCWKFEGKKYEFAKKFNTVIVNHRWVEECIKQGKRVPEHPYVLQSGEEIGPLSLEIPLVNVAVTTKNRKTLTDKSNICDSSGKQTIDLDYGVSGLTAWTNSCLLNKHEESSSHSSKHPDKGKKKRSTGKGSNISSEPSRKGRRLVKNRDCINILESGHLDSDQLALKIGGTSDDHLLDQRGITIESSEASEDSNLGVKNASTTAFKIRLQDVPINVEDVKEEIKDESEVEHVTRLSTSTELSCVICWTDFSSTRGVLPCGHRFCYSCIQNWADCMASRRKISTCPLCKASFVSITKVEDAASSDQKIYSQTIPCAASDLDIFILTDQETHSFGAQSSLAPICSACRFQEPEDLLISCHLCQMRHIHSYCLDPPLLPWTCMHCKDLQMLYHHTC